MSFSILVLCYVPLLDASVGVSLDAAGALRYRAWAQSWSSAALAAPGSSVVKNPPTNAGDLSSIPGLGRSLEKELATHSSILAWKIPWTEEPDGRPGPPGEE